MLRMKPSPLRLSSLACLACVAALALLPACGSSNGASNDSSDLPRLPTRSLYQLQPLQKRDVTLSVDLSDETPRVTVFRGASSQPADEDYARAMAAKLGIVGEPELGEEAHYLVKGEAGDLDISAVDDFMFTAAPRRDEQGISGQLDDGELGEAAKTFLSAHDLLPPNAEVAAVERQPGRWVVDIEDKRISPSLAPATPIIRVGVGGDGSVLWVGYGWRPVEAVGDYPLISQNEAFDRIFQQGKSDYVVSQLPIQITSVELAFQQDSDTNVNSPVFLPFYRFQGPGNASIWVSALPDKYVATDRGVN